MRSPRKRTTRGIASSGSTQVCWFWPCSCWMLCWRLLLVLDVLTTGAGGHRRECAQRHHPLPRRCARLCNHRRRVRELGCAPSIAPTTPSQSPGLT